MAGTPEPRAGVTGSTSGIGRGAALALGRLGARVFVHGRDADAGQAVVTELDLLVNNAGALLRRDELTDFGIEKTSRRMLGRGFEPRSSARKAEMIGRTTPTERTATRRHGRIGPVVFKIVSLDPVCPSLTWSGQSAASTALPSTGPSSSTNCLMTFSSARWSVSLQVDLAMPDTSASSVSVQSRGVS